MIIESLISSIFDLFANGSDLVDIENGVDAIFTVMSYIGYLDPIVPVGLLISCAIGILVYTVIACLIRLCVALAT